LTYLEEMKDFLNAIYKKLSLKHTFFDELKILRISDAIELSNIKKVKNNYTDSKEEYRIYKGNKKVKINHGNKP
jgi:hypothetical protein